MRQFILLAAGHGGVLTAIGGRHATLEQATAEVHQVIASHSKIVVAELVTQFRANVTAREYDDGDDIVKLLPRR